MDFPPSDIPNDASRSKTLTNKSLQLATHMRRQPQALKILRSCKIIAASALVFVAALLGLLYCENAYLAPLFIAILVVAPLCMFRLYPKWFCLALPVMFIVSLCVDSFVFKHRFSIGLRAWSLLGDGVESVLPSPSGRSTAYISCIYGGSKDYAYLVYISDGCFFSKESRIISSNNNSLTLKWNGDVFTAVEYPEQNGEINRAAKKVMVFRYTESTGILEDDKEQLRFENSEPDTKGGQSRDGEQ